MKLRNLLTLAILSSMTIASSAAPSTQAADIPNMRAYQAEYELSSNGSKRIHRLAFDGKGHGRSEMIAVAPASHRISIMDLGTHQIKMMDVNSKTVMSMALQDDDIDQLSGFGKKIKSSAKQLGVRTIDGHVCTGTHYQLDGGSEEEIWTGNDIAGTRVYSKVTMPGFGVTEAHLKSYKATAPSPDSFNVPADFKAL